MADVLLHALSLSKSYGGVRALSGIELEIRRGEVHALCGENGAGKSTFIKCVSGVEVPSAGTILLDGHPLPFGDVRASEASGIAVLHQESTVFPDLTPVDNLFAGREPARWRGLALDRRRMRREAAAVFRRLGHTIDMKRPVGDLSLSDRQAVAMARAISQECRLLVLDEPTASLSARETETLLGLIGRLRQEGVTVLYVSHRLDEIFKIADRVTVFRDGRHVETRDIRRTTKSDLIRLMVGREVEESIGRHEHAGSAAGARLSVKRLTGGAFQDVSLDVRGGEIVGLAGLVGAGRSEVARAIFGIDHYDSGEVLVDGKVLRRGSVRAAVRRGLALVPEDRQHEGLFLPMTVAENLSLVVLRRITRGGLISGRSERRLAARLMENLQIKAEGPDVPAESLSGGNQQKLVLAKWLALEPGVLILDEPTRGVDVGAKAQVHKLVRELVARGVAIFVISSELPELLAICDRILVMREGRISGDLDGRTATQEEILALALPDGNL